MSEIIKQAIETAAASPKDVAAGGHRVVQHSLRDLIEVDKHLDEQETKNSRKLPIRLFKTRPGGAV